MEPFPPDDAPPGWLPAWIHRLGVALWISGPDRRIRFVNERAAKLLERGAAECEGQPCHGVVAGRDAAGRPFCSERCPLVCSIDRGEEIEPFVLRLGGAAPARCVEVQCVPLTAPDNSGSWIVHLAQDIGHEQRMAEFLTRVASRTPRDAGRDGGARLSALTAREREILARLAHDEDLPAIAAALYVSHATVRNHVQHILTKLDVHSTLEAVALHLLDGDPPT